MVGTLRRWRIATAAFAATLALSSPAWADDFVAECKKGTRAADPDKSCNCMSGKVMGAERADAIAGMRSMNTAASGGTAPDPTKLPAAEQAGLRAVMAASEQCK
jgi:hypothetical protein